ncbi:uncharacterized protein EDB91DRAFT_1106081, partial [Suillus paluster]|uniref:uncharacterized protein n=1 Tax=Suillus paluster TaxID=48578 RepID=UPI001B8690EA
MKKPRWYVVVVGSEPGIYTTWIECRGKIKHCPRQAVYESFDTYEEALRAYHGALQRGEVEVVLENAGAVSASATRVKYEMDGHIFQPVAPSRVDSVTGARAVQSRQALWDDMSLLHSPSQTLPPSPSTGVTQYVDLEGNSLLQPPRGLSPRVAVEDTSYTSSWVNEVSPFLSTSRPAHIRRVEASPTSSMMSAEETSSPRALRRQRTVPASFEMGARYPTLEEIHKGQGLDPRIMLPPSRVFDPANIKPRPGAISPRRKNSQMDAEPTNPRDSTTRDCLPAVSCPEDDGQSASSLPRRRVANKGKSRALADAAAEALSLIRSVFPPIIDTRSQSIHTIFKKSTRLIGLNGVALLSYTVHQGTACRHGHCESASACAAVKNDGVQSRYVDAGVSPILPSVSSARETANTRGPVARVSDASSGQEFHSFLGISCTPQLPHRGYPVDSDVRSPFAPGTRVPSRLSELSIFGRP